MKWVCFAPQARHQQYPEALFALSDRVRDQYTEAMSRLSDAELQNHDKVVSFKESIRSSIKQGRMQQYQQYLNLQLT